jgi:hypothetical protein
MAKQPEPSPITQFRLLDAIQQLRSEIDDAQRKLSDAGKEPLLWLTEGEIELQLEVARDTSVQAEAGGKVSGFFHWVIAGARAEVNGKTAGKIDWNRTATHTMRLKFVAKTTDERKSVPPDAPPPAKQIKSGKPQGTGTVIGILKQVPPQDRPKGQYS